MKLLSCCLLLSVFLIVCKGVFLSRYHFNGSAVNEHYTPDSYIDDLSGSDNVLFPIGDDIRVAADRNNEPTAIELGVADYLYSKQLTALNEGSTYTFSTVFSCEESCTLFTLSDPATVSYCILKVTSDHLAVVEVIQNGNMVLELSSNEPVPTSDWNVIGVIKTKTNAVQIILNDKTVAEGQLEMASTFEGSLLLGGAGPVTYDLFSIQEGDASAIEDPHLETFDGRKFDFMGYAGRYYALYSDSKIQINCKLAPWDIWGPNATVISEIGILTEKARISVHRAGEITLNNRFLEQQGESIKLDNGVLETTLGRLKLSTIQALVRVDVVEEDFGHYLNIVVRQGPHVANPHGLLGQSSENRSESDPYQGEMGDYEVTSLFSHEFTFSRFVI